MAIARSVKTKGRTVSESHKAAMAQGRTESRSVAQYLDALATHAPKRGRKRTSDSVERRLATIEDSVATASPIHRLSLIQERLDLQRERAGMSESFDIPELEDDFVDVAKAYSDRKGISYAAWRELGVQPAVLKRAGVTRAG